MLMEVCDGCPPQFMLSRASIRCSQLGTERFHSLQPSSLYLYPRMPFQIFLSSTHLVTLNSFSKSPLMSVKKGNVGTTSQRLCKVVWIIEADISNSRLLYITGDPVALGCWEPEMAILMCPDNEHANLWKTEIKVPCGSNFKYNYFIKGETWTSCDLLWRPGPQFSLSIPAHCEYLNRKITVRDSWMKTRTERLSVPSWGSWLEEIDLPVVPIELEGYRAPSSGTSDIVENLNGDPLLRKTCSGAESHSIEQEVAKSPLHVSDLVLNSFERNHQFVEEPWFLKSTLVSNTGLDKKLTQLVFSDEGDEEIKLAQIEHSVSTVILINSSVCTMQRIAVLEDGKLVELLLEPVKNHVQCDSVYLGVVTKLVPHLGGAFVEIGISRPSLMDIKRNREPFAYPPFRHKTKGQEVNGSLISEPKENPETELPEDSDEDDFLEVELPEDSREHEAEYELELSDSLKMKTNNGGFEYGAGDVDFEEYVEGNGHNLESETVQELLLDTGDSDHGKLSNHMLQDLTMGTCDAHPSANKWAHVRKGTKVIVQVVKEGLGTKGPALTPYPNLKSRFWVLSTRCDRIGVSKKISGIERTRLRVIAKTLQPSGFGLTVRTVAAGHSLEELQKDLEGLLSTWKGIIEHAKSAALAADEGVEGAIPMILHQAMGQTLSVVQDYFNEKVESMVVDSPRTYHEVTNYLQEIAPDLCDRVMLHDKRIPVFDEYGIEEEINNILSKKVLLPNGGSLVIEQTEALVSIDVNGGHGMLGQRTSQEQAILDVNLVAAKQIARELRLRDIGGIIVVDFIDMTDESNKRLVYEEIKKAVERDRSMVKVSELSRHGLMEITRKRVRPSVTFMISEPCNCCHATGRVEALETSFSKIEHEICRLLASSNQNPDLENANSWPRFVLRVDRYMCNYLTAGKRTKLAILSSSFKVWILLKVTRGFSRGEFEVKPFTDEKASNDQQQVAISRLHNAETGSYIPSTKLTLFPFKKWKTGRK